MEGKEFLGNIRGPTGCIYWHFLTREPWRWEDGQSSTFRQQSWEQGEHQGWFLTQPQGGQRCLTDVHPGKGEGASGIRHSVLSCWASVAKQVGEGHGRVQNRFPRECFTHYEDCTLWSSEEPTKMLHRKASIWLLLLEGTTAEERKTCFFMWLNNSDLLFFSVSFLQPIA